MQESQKGAETSVQLFITIIRQWRDFKKGIPPSREWKGRGGQNPRLLRAFEALDAVSKDVSLQ